MRVIVVAGIVLTILLLSLLISKRRKLFADRYLMLYLFFAAVNQVYIYFETTGLFQESYWMLFCKGIYLLCPPLFFLYVYALSKQKAPPAWQVTVLFLPLAAYVFHYFYYYFFVFDTVSIFIENGLLYVNDKLSPTWTAFVILFFFVEPILLLWFYFLLKDYKKMMRNSISSFDRMQLGWLNVIFYLWLINVAVLVPVGTVTVSKGWFSVNTFQILIEVSVVVFYFIVGFYGFRQTTVFTNLELITEPPIKSGTKSYERSGLSSSQAKEYQANLIQVMEYKKPFLNGELTARQLATELGISVNHLSQVLNQEQNQNFFDFVNSYRVNEVIKKMGDRKNDHLTLLAIGLDSGFNSKTSFNAVFKKFTNQTPSQFYKASSK